jgi:SARP family transcriptional regulator, regulator of embCAB operon
MPPQGDGGGSPDRTRVSIHLFGGFGLVADGTRLPMPEMAAKVVAYVALEQRPVKRRTLAGALWPRSSRQRAHGALRSTMYRARGIDCALVVGSDEVALAPDVSVDTEVLLQAIAQLGGSAPAAPIDGFPTRWLSRELLPEWCDEWVVAERERFRQIALGTLEELSARYARQGNSTSAVDCALAAIRLEPVRESAHRALMTAHLANGNVSEALEQFDTYRRILAAELAVEPSPQMVALVRSIGRAPADGAR